MRPLCKGPHKDDLCKYFRVVQTVCKDFQQMILAGSVKEM